MTMKDLQQRVEAHEKKIAEQARLKSEKEAKKAAEEAAAKEQAEAKKKAEDEAHKDDPKYIAKKKREEKKAAARAEKQRVKEQEKEIKRQKKVDKHLTKIFNRLIKDNEVTFKALTSNYGKLEHDIGGYNSVKDFFRTAGGFIGTYSGEIKNEDIENNKAFQNYKAALAEQGYDVKVLWTSDGLQSMNNISRYGFGGLGTGVVITAGMVAAPPLLLLAAIPYSFGSMLTGTTNASFSLQITKKTPTLALEDKRSEQEKANAVLSDIKTPEKQTVTEQTQYKPIV